MSAGSWQGFADALEAESQSLGELGAAALVMTSNLIFGTAAEIETADRNVDARRLTHARLHARRATMMQSGFGELTLREVCAYAPGPLRRVIQNSFSELRTRAIALQITVANNKVLIAAGLARIASTLNVMQKNLSEHTGTYRRRGTVAPLNGSLIMSRKA